ncbi:MAG TPA: Mut7-C RNAse domain-containing protein [Nevskiaceae bacterium]|nr:Mut7-C RNAse domain-containing protein [Nevskiaceae bacterium]
MTPDSPRYFIASRRGILPAGGTVAFRFYAELNDHLAPRLRQRTFDHPLSGRPAVKDVIEALGVPHTEVELILVDGASVGFDEPLHDGERISVYPMFETLDVAPLLRLRPRPPRTTRFVLDGHLGRLARHLRMLGFDTRYAQDCDDAALVQASIDERRILLTRDRGLLKRSAVTHGAFVYATAPREQVLEVVERFDLRRSMRPFRRCTRCNGRLLRASKTSLAGLVDAPLLARHRAFKRCRDCGQVYWPGTHVEHMRRFVEELGAA